MSAQDYNFELRSTLEFPGQTLANVHGYVANGHEYALVGGQLGLIIIDVTDPDNPVQIKQIPGPSSLWREIKTYQNVAVVTTEHGPVQIVDLTNLPDTSLQVNTYTGDGEIAGSIGAIHALHIDEAKGFCYLYGGSASGAWILDMKNDPMNPTYVGEYQTLGYIHDGYVENDTLYAGHIYAGYVAVVDMTDKQNPNVLGTVETPNHFPHNTWITSDHKTMLTTDETDYSYLTAFDISDLSNIKELDRFQCTPNSGSVPHNTHVLNDFAVTSWYTDGVSIVDVHKPDNLVQVAWYDTYPQQAGPGYNGCWGVYPFFPSGNFVATNIPIAFQSGTGKFFVLTPTIVRAAYLEGKVTSAANGEKLSDVIITLNSSNPLSATTTDLGGEYKTGQPEAGTFQVTFEKDDFLPKTMEAILVNGEVTILDVTLDLETSASPEVENGKARLSVYPVVFSNETRIEVSLPAQAAGGELQLSDLTGKVVWRQAVSQGETSVILNEKLPAGAMILNLMVNEQQVAAQKIIKK